MVSEFTVQAVLTVASGRFEEVIIMFLFGAFVGAVGAVVHFLETCSEVVGDVVAVGESGESVFSGMEAVEEASLFLADDVGVVAVCACVFGLAAATAENKAVAWHL